MADMQGVKVVFGSEVSGTVGIVTSGKYRVNGVEYNNAADIRELRDESNEVRSVVISGKQEELSITYRPFDATSGDTAKSNFTVPAIGTKVTLSGTGVEGAGGNQITGDWMVVSARKSARSDEIAEISVTLRRWPNVTLS